MNLGTIRVGIAAAALAALGFAASASAHPGNGNGGGHMGFGGMSGSHISEHGAFNSNGPNAVDREFGRDRAIERENFRHHREHVFHVNAGGSANAIAHRWRHGRHHHYGWRAR
ncbi:MAG: hypothetical protein JO294_00600 [Alphaproteobacteria bacterium]|nr:hypothetical protein [Alphaproteobacteria bacterium]